MLDRGEEIPENKVRSDEGGIKRYLWIDEFGIVPRVNDELPFHGYCKTGDDSRDTIRVSLYVASNCEDGGSSCLCELFLEIKAA